MSVAVPIENGSQSGIKLTRRDFLKILILAGTGVALSGVPGSGQGSPSPSPSSVEGGASLGDSSAGTGPVPDGGKDLDSIKPLATANKPVPIKEATTVSPTKVPPVVESTPIPESKIKIGFPDSWTDAPRINSVAELLEAERLQFKFGSNSKDGGLNVLQPSQRTPFTELKMTATSLKDGVKPVSCGILTFQSKPYFVIGVAVKQGDVSRFVHFAVATQFSGVSTSDINREFSTLLKYLKQASVSGRFEIGGGIGVGKDTAGVINIRESMSNARDLINKQNLSNLFGGGLNDITSINSAKENVLIPMISRGQ